MGYQRRVHGDCSTARTHLESTCPQSPTTRSSPKKRLPRRLLLRQRPLKRRQRKQKKPKNKSILMHRPTGQIQNIMVFLSSIQQKNIRYSEDKNRKSTNSFYPKKPNTIKNLQKCADDKTTRFFGSIKI